MAGEHCSPLQNKKSIAARRYHNSSFLTKSQMRLSVFEKTQVIVSKLCRHTSPWGLGEEAKLHKIRLANVLNGDRLLADSRRKGFKSHWAAVLAFYYHRQQTFVERVKSQLVNVHSVEGYLCNVCGYPAVAHDFGKITHTP